MSLRKTARPFTQTRFQRLLHKFSFITASGTSDKSVSISTSHSSKCTESTAARIKRNDAESQDANLNWGDNNNLFGGNYDGSRSVDLMRRRMFSTETVISHQAEVIAGRSRSLQEVPAGAILHTLMAERIPPERETNSLRNLDQTVPLRLEASSVWILTSGTANGTKLIEAGDEIIFNSETLLANVLFDQGLQSSVKTCFQPLHFFFFFVLWWKKCNFLTGL